MTALTNAAHPSTGKRILRNASSILVSNAAGEILSTYAVGLAALALGPAGFGTLAAAQAFMDPFETLAGFGLIQVSITLAAARAGCDATLRTTVMMLRLAFAAVAIAVAFGVALATDRGALAPLLVLLAVNSLVSPLQQASTLPFQYEQSMHRLMTVPFLASVVRVGTSYGAYWLLCTPFGFQASATIAAVISALLTFLFARRYYGVGFSFDRQFARRLIVLAWPAATLEVIVMVYCRASYFLLHDAGPAVQGEFAAADRLVKPILALASAVVVSSLPTIAVMAARQEFVQLLRVYKRSVTRIVVTLTPIAIAACLLMPYLLRRFAPVYADASSSFRILTVGAMFMFLNQLSSAFIVSLGKFRLIMTIGFVNLVVYFALALFLIPRYEAVGAAISTALTEATNAILQSLAVLLLLRRFIRRGNRAIP
jgi:PST family polysaccharide transporter